MPFPSLSRPASKGDRDEKIQPPKQLAKKGIPLYILKKCLEGDGGQLKFRPQVKSGARAGDLLKGDGGQVEQGLEFEVEIHSYGTMSRERRKEMLDLVEENMKAMYANTQKGWSRAEKRAELSDRSTWLRFLLVLRSVGGEVVSPDSLPKTKAKAFARSPPKSPIKVLVGFIAFTVTCEPEVYDRPSDTVPVTYCYEIQVGPAYRCTGLGRFLMQQLHLTAQQVGVPDVRLTVFKENLNARRFYEKFGYVTHCDDSEDDYMILKKLV